MKRSIIIIGFIIAFSINSFALRISSASQAASGPGSSSSASSSGTGRSSTSISTVENEEIEFDSDDYSNDNDFEFFEELVGPLIKVYWLGPIIRHYDEDGIIWNLHYPQRIYSHHNQSVRECIK